jgi:hypothetical protein
MKSAAADAIRGMRSNQNLPPRRGRMISNHFGAHPAPIHLQSPSTHPFAHQAKASETTNLDPPSPFSRPPAIRNEIIEIRVCFFETRPNSKQHDHKYERFLT